MSPQEREDFSSCGSSSASMLRPSRGRSSDEQQPPHVDAREQQQCFLLQQQQRLQEPQACLAVQPMAGEHRVYQREQPPGMTHKQEQQLLVRALQREEQQQSCYASSSSSGDHVRRTCFICLEGAKRNKRDPSKRRDLYSCCTQCYVVVHRNCWAAYRRRQQLATFRARLLGQRAPTPHLCSICKTGSAGVTGDPPLPRRGGGKRGSSTEAAAFDEGGAAAGQRGRNSSVLQEQLLASLGRLLQNDDEDTDRPPLCTGLCMCINTGVLVAVLLVDLLLMAFTCIYPLQVLLVSLFLCYNAVVIQLLILAIRQRREYMRMYMSAGSEEADNNEGSDASSSSGSSGGRRGSEGSRVSSGAGDYERRRRRSFEEGEYNPYITEGEEVEMEEGELFDEEGAAGRGSSLETARRGLRSVFLVFSSSPPGGHSSAGRRRQGSSSSGSHGGRRRSNSSSGSGAGRREAFLRVNDRESGSADSRIGELWTAAKRFYFSLLRDAWRWTERSASAVGEPLGGGGWREDPVLQEDLGPAAASTAGEYYRRAEAAVEAHLAADVEMQTLGVDVPLANSSAAPEPQHLRQVSVRSS